MNIKEKKDQIVEWVKENKLNVLLGIGGIVTVVVLTTNIRKPATQEDMKKESYIEPDESDPGRNILMTFTYEDTGEVLWKERCCEDYLNDSIESGMQYAEVRQLNGIEEA